MKVGDIVKQSGDLMRLHKHGKPVKPPKMLGVVIAIDEIDPRFLERQPDWALRLGRSVTVRWNNGIVKENFAEGSLEVVSEGR